ncbi:hypothetical protein [Chitinophaga ginsengisoli]|uniref:Uncharacterized protein n=1 Tax=Chitinophaga ginsengisoli TaxID=363837 RepID=A0A2P8G2M7_9BACT|nr:hypothetical protein [Chitinophaga ginsengisoli]PSL28232.1 hypothetical protein CLV42_108151 [Chitinophaga ginsengisoli]
MYTQVQLSAEDQQLLKSLRRAANVEGYIGIGVGIVLTLLSCGLAGLMMSDGYFPGVEVLLPFFLILLCLGVFLLYRGFRIHRKTKAQFAQIQAKRIVTGRLQQLETIDKKNLRYTVGGASFPVYVPLPVYLAKTEYKRPLVSATALLNREIALHLVPIEPGIELLLQCHYNQSAYKTSVPPLEESDKQRQLDNFNAEVKVILIVFAVVGFIIAMIAGFRTEVWFILGLMLLLLVIIVASTSLPRLINIMKGTNKICITTTITEKIEAMARSGKTMSKHTWYRLGNGTLEQHQIATFYPGDTVMIEHLEKKNGNKGTLLDIKKV